MLEQDENPRTQEDQHQKVGRMNPCPEKSKQWLAYFTGRRDYKPHYACRPAMRARRAAAEIIFGAHRIIYPAELSMTYKEIRTRSKSASASTFFRRIHVPSFEPLRAVIGLPYKVYPCLRLRCLLGAYIKLPQTTQCEPGASTPVRGRVDALAVAASTDTCPFDLLCQLLHDADPEQGQQSNAANLNTYLHLYAEGLPRVLKRSAFVSTGNRPTRRLLLINS
ncbi:hypothetical protein ACQKWADRAFT_30484 [Trichoderma austrokoningii]